MKKQNSKKKESEDLVNHVGKKVGEFTKQYGPGGNILKALGIVSALGAVTYLAFRFVPWNKVLDALEENLERLENSFNEALKEDTYASR